jgi:ribosomal protein S18 acetylase RimI-like enzyme
MSQNPLSEEQITSPEECEALAALAREIWEEWFTPIIGANQVAYMLEKFQSATAIWSQIQDGMRYFVVNHKQNPVGYYAIKKEETRLFLSKIYLKRSMRGIGAGAWMLSECAKKAKAENLSSIYLTVNKGNEKAIRFYERYQFKKMISLEKDIGRGFIMNDWLMEKSLED